MKNNNLFEQLQSEIYKELLKKHFDYNITNIQKMSKSYIELFDKYTTKKITETHKDYEFETHLAALIFENTIFLYKVDDALIGYMKTPNNKEYIVSNRDYEYHIAPQGTSIANWVNNFQPSLANETIQRFMMDCHNIFGSNMNMYDPSEDDCGNFGFNFN